MVRLLEHVNQIEMNVGQVKFLFMEVCSNILNFFQITQYLAYFCMLHPILNLFVFFSLQVSGFDLTCEKIWLDGGSAMSQCSEMQA